MLLYGHKSLFSAGAGIASRNKRYIVWFCSTLYLPLEQAP
jgi:hypothetical protein